MSSKRSITKIKDLFGTMFEIRSDAEGKKFILPTNNPTKAEDIVPPGIRKCPNCSSPDCLDNIVATELLFPGFWAKDKMCGYIKYIDIATCKKNKDFLVARKSFPDHETKGRCVWCTSPEIKKIPDIKNVRKSFFLPSNIKKYKWKLFESTNLVYGNLMEGMSIDDLSLFIFKEPWKCKQCRRVFGYEEDFEEGQELMLELIARVRKHEAGEFLKKRGIEWREVAIKRKCPYCQSEIDTKRCLGFYISENDLDADSAGFNHCKYSCWKCNKIFFGIIDWRMLALLDLIEKGSQHCQW